MKKTTSGFTIVELLIVIVVIAILAAITIVAYNGIQGRARDSQRLSDMKTIQKALEIYKTNNGIYPAAVITPNTGGFETSTNGTNATNFLSALVGPNGVSSISVDPKNSGNGTGTPANSLTPGNSSLNYEYFYYRYNAGYNGCDAARGDFYVLGVSRMDTISSGQKSPDSPGFSCSTGWQSYGAWVTGGYTN